jgi:hypothetical protein
MQYMNADIYTPDETKRRIGTQPHRSGADSCTLNPKPKPQTLNPKPGPQRSLSRFAAHVQD